MFWTLTHKDTHLYVLQPLHHSSCAPRLLRCHVARGQRIEGRPVGGHTTALSALPGSADRGRFRSRGRCYCRRYCCWRCCCAIARFAFACDALDGRRQQDWRGGPPGRRAADTVCILAQVSHLGWRNDTVKQDNVWVGPKSAAGCSDTGEQAAQRAVASNGAGCH